MGVEDNTVNGPQAGNNSHTISSGSPSIPTVVGSPSLHDRPADRVPTKKRKYASEIQEHDPRGKKGKPTKPEKPREKRLKRERKVPSQDFLTILTRARTQRMFVINRERTGTPEEPEETIKIAGTTGNLYTVVINKVPSCNCPHATRGNHCKHIVYVLAKTLKARYHLQYQTALLSNEVQEIFQNAPPLPTEAASPEDTSGIRKPIEDDCPICCVEFDPKADDIVYCKAACGNNIHKECFQQWASQKKSNREKVTCPFCRTTWEDEAISLANIDTASGQIGRGGYVNLASQLGISGHRDTSTYHSFWVRAERRRGGLEDEDPELAASSFRYY